MDRSLGFGSTDTDKTPCSDSLSLRLRLNTLTTPVPRNSQVHSSIGTRLALPCGMGLSRFVSARFHVLFHSPSGVLFTFPSRYYALSVTTEYLALEDGPPRFRQGFSCPALLTNDPNQSERFKLRDYHRLWCGFPAGFVYRSDFLLSSSRRRLERLPCNPPSRNAPTLTRAGFRLFPVRSPLLRES